MTCEGYLVVEKNPADARESANPLYKGIDRIPPWSQVRYEAGFDGPYLFGDQRDANDLFPSREKAYGALEELAKIHPRERLGIVFVQEIGEPRTAESFPDPATLLGFDVAATESPFWSVLGDPPLATAIRGWIGQTNEHGLFPSEDLARKYLDLYEALKSEGDGTFAIWRIFDVT